MIYLVEPAHFSEIAGNYLGTLVDSAVIEPDGQFVFTNLVSEDEAKLYILIVQKTDSRFPRYLDDEDPRDANYMPVSVSPDTPIFITADIRNFQSSFSIRNPDATNSEFALLRDIRVDAFNQLKHELSRDTHDEKFIIEREEAHQRYTQHLRDFANETNHYFAGLVAIRWVSPTGDFERNPEFLIEQCTKWMQENHSHPFTGELCIMADKSQLPVVVGDIIPNFDLPMLSGETRSLHALLGDELTIVDIWASWCAPCRKENRAVLAPLYSAYKDHGVNIIGYALDSGEKPWKAAIEKDGAIWDHASHLTGDESPFMDALRITTIPANYILDADGKILAKNLHGEELTEFVRATLE